MKNMNLSENETKALRAICADCAEIEGYGFDRPLDMLLALADEFGPHDDPTTMMNAVRGLMKKRLIDVYPDDNEVWVEPDVFSAYC